MCSTDTRMAEQPLSRIMQGGISRARCSARSYGRLNSPRDQFCQELDQP